MLDAVIVAGAAFAVLAVVLLMMVLLRLQRPAAADPALLARLQGLGDGLDRSERLLREEFARGREENAAAARQLREEVTATLNRVGDSIATTVTRLSQLQGQKLDDVTRQIALLTEGNEKRQENLQRAVEAKLVEIKTDAATGATQLKDEMARSLKAAGDTLGQGLTRMSESQRERLAEVTLSLGQMTTQNREQQDQLRKAVEGRLDVLRQENADKLEQMRLTVDEKLQGTLEQRLGASFKLVNDQLEQVYKSVGEMQALASGVGDLKKVLTNVKTRGTWGEVALGNLLEQMLAPGQYEGNVEVNPGSGQRVEFAVKLPGTSEDDKPVWLPIDAKFPAEDYDRLVDAAERADVAGVETAAAGIEQRIRQAAKDISEKYVVAPHSTDFGVLFLPTEGLFAEVIRRPGLVEALQRDLRIVVVGPTTLAAFLNSLRVGFKTLAIQKQSSQVWQVLAAVKTEFGKYGEVMQRVQKKLHEASEQIDKVGVRRRAIERQLRGVEALPDSKAAAILELPAADDEDVLEANDAGGR